MVCRGEFFNLDLNNQTAGNKPGKGGGALQANFVLGPERASENAGLPLARMLLGDSVTQGLHSHKHTQTYCTCGFFIYSSLHDF